MLSTTAVEHVDVLIIGAGISGIGAAYHLQDQRPGDSFLVLDALPDYGGTWWTNRYPGVRSDSDLYTFGFRFKPWSGPPIATAEEIRTYLGEVIEENDLGQRIRYGHHVTEARWSSEDAEWTVSATDLDSGEERTFTAGFLWMCQGYYHHGQGYTPSWPGFEDYAGTVLHPQEWPDEVDLAGKRVVVIGSGATAATLVPAIAGEAAHVTMLQRSPTFFFAGPNSNELADTLRGLDVPEEWTHEIVRRQYLQLLDILATTSAEQPELMRQMLLDDVRSRLPEGFDVDRHFSPSYRPWQQRIALVPDGDLFSEITKGTVSIVTDTIERFTPTGIETTQGEVLDADVVITATGFDLSVLGNIDFVVDGHDVDPGQVVTYRGIMFTDLPNLAYVFGYFRASWTLRAEIISDYVCRLLDHMKKVGAHQVVPVIRDDEADMIVGPWVDPDNFNPGYLTRSMDLMPKQGAHDPWRWGLEYPAEKIALAEADLEDGVLRYR